MLKYQKVIFEIEFKEEIYFSVYPIFLFRSLLGKELRNLSCLFRSRKCINCDLKYQCAYSKLFETPIPKNNDFLKGRNFAPHPIILFTDAKYKEKNKKINLEVMLIGDDINYLPYIFYSFQKAGELGIERDRVKYQIKNVFIENGKSILENNSQINMDFKVNKWKLELNNNIVEKNKKIINFVTPLRLKINGNLSNDFKYEDVLKSAFRRVRILEEMYGSVSDISSEFGNILNKTEKNNLHWIDLYHHSSRQKKGMKLGGVVGSMIVDGDFSGFEISLLKFIELFNIGKNISFGLGKVEIS